MFLKENIDQDKSARLILKRFVVDVVVSVVVVVVFVVIV